MDRLDHSVTHHLMEKLLTGDRLWELLSTLATRRAERAAAVDARLAALEREAANAEEKLKRLYKLVEDGVAEMDDLLKERIMVLKKRPRPVAGGAGSCAWQRKGQSRGD